MSAHFLRYIMFFLTFTLDVRIRAAETVTLPTAKNPIQMPQQCFEKNETCAIRTRADEKFPFLVGESSVVLDSNSLVIRSSTPGAEVHLKLVKGTLWIRAEKSLSVETAFGRVESEGAGEIWLEVSGRATKITVIEGVAHLIPRGSHTVYGLYPGEENEMSGVDRYGRSRIQVPRALALKEHIFRWARLYEGSLLTFEEQAKNVRESWKVAVTKIAKLNEGLVSRRMASLEEAHRKHAEVKAQTDAENKKLRALFRKKVLFESEPL